MKWNFLIYPNQVKNFLDGSADCCSYSSLELRKVKHISPIHLTLFQPLEGISTGAKSGDLPGQKLRPYFPIHELENISTEKWIAHVMG